MELPFGLYLGVNFDGHGSDAIRRRCHRRLTPPRHL
jgi:hypothetical protein